MQFKLFTIPVTDTGKFIDEMNAFLRGNKILQVEKQFVNDSNYVIYQRNRRKKGRKIFRAAD